jgi:hypothetical protein
VIKHLQLQQGWGWVRSLVPLLVTLVLIATLSACSRSSALLPGLVEQALTLQINQTSDLLTQQLKLSTATQPLIDLNRVTIVDEQPLLIEDLPGFRVQGVYDAIVYLPDRQLKQRQNSFELYLQRQIEGKTWRLAHPFSQSDGSLAWSTQRLE